MLLSKIPKILTFRIFGIICLLLEFVAVASAQVIPLKFSYLTVDNGLSHTDTKEIKQDSAGFIWIATLYGLSRYDGYTIKKFYNTNYPLRNAANNRILSLSMGDNGRIWLATEGGIQCFDSKRERYIDYDFGMKPIGEQHFNKIVQINKKTIGALLGNVFKVYHLNGDSLTALNLPHPKNTKFTDFLVNKEGIVYLSANDGVWTFDSKLHLKRFEINNASGRRYADFSGIFLDRKDNLLLSSNTKLLKIRHDYAATIKNAGKSNSGRITVETETELGKGLDILDLVQDNRYNYWISTEDGLMYLDGKTASRKLITSNSFVQSLNTNTLSRLFIDRSGCLWTCTYGGGVNFCDLNPKLFYTLQNNPQLNNTLSGNVIKAVLEENEQKVWIGTNANGLNEYNFVTKTYKHYATDTPVKLKSNQVNALVFDDDHNLWVGTGKGIDILRKNGKLAFDIPGSEKLPLQAVTGLLKDCYGNIWFALRNVRIGCIVLKNSQITDVRYYGEGHFFSTDSKVPEIMVASISGLRRDIIDRNGSIIKTFHYAANGKSNSLSSPYTWPIKKQNDSTYWIGTLGGGLNQLILRKNNDYVIHSYGKRYGIFNDVESIEIDTHGKIWVGGNGLQCFDPKTKKLVSYDQKSGLQGNSFKVGASFTGKNGRLYFGGINGLNYFNPDSIKGNDESVRPVFTDLIVNNRKANIGERDNPVPQLQEVISYSKTLNLSHLQNNFVVYFSSMQFSNPLICKYRYKLQGYDTDWKYTDGINPSASYTNLDYDSYQLLVEASNHDGVWGGYHAVLNISVAPPWWKSLTAKIIYAFIIMLSLAGIYIYQARWFRLKSELAVRNVEEQKREEIHQHREELYQQQLDFFTSISHEFRTPLMLILGPLEVLVKEAKQSGHYHSFQMMHRNAKRLLNLINELMNFRKLSDSAITLEVKPVCLDLFVKGIHTTFEDLSANKNIQFKIIPPKERITTLLDEQVLQKILFNVLTNAFKYTKPEGQVTLEVLFDWEEPELAPGASFKLLHERRSEQYVYFRILDTGIGISADSISLIFDRYYRVSNNHLGSGIGLSLVKALTSLHQGDIYVYSEKLKGTEIIIAIPHQPSQEPVTESVPGSSQKASLEKIDYTDILVFNHPEPETTYPLSSEITAHVLLVEDNDELRCFLKDRLKQNYVVYEAVDGKQGYEMACEKMPDLIISDVMMPVMNGVELCRELKSAPATSHIPFIMMSAKEALDAQVTGLESGADYYFPKPLSVDMLLLTVHNIFNQKQKLKSKYTSDHYLEASDRLHSMKDKEFLDKVVAIIEDNLETPALDVEFICQHMFISRTKLYQKVQAITGHSVGDLIRTVRMKKAMHLLTHEEISISDLTVRVGYTSTSYFSSAFRKEFGKSPSQYLQTIRIAKS